MNEVAGTFFALGVLAIIGAIIGLVIVQVFSTARAKMSVQREEAYSRLAEEATEFQRRILDELERTRAELATLREQTADLNRVLSQVE